ncbi:hypothetical protein EDB81DRAFT_715975 [Dactylonectria macrodidyma]|uniref:Zn(2)-C6 fungal-type domain-containing protein n=1 Tax=Dactylonectria macrodidyma TaxID=307937 RepID=A0A9P9JDG8_9HYPO|nr:hypothetical protein EDB81DRAFT_715975 [Dactylonectria macrodidyma]
MASTPDSLLAPEPRITKLRKAHTKSRTGCTACKKRKIKCGEEKPICKNCQRSKGKCHFVTNPYRASSPSTFPSPPPSWSPDMLAMELLHNFCTSTYATLSDDPLIRDLWRVRVVKLCFTCDHAMLALLSVSALHLAQFSPSRRDILRERAIMYHNKASSIATKYMSNLDEDNSQGLFAFSIFTIYFAFATSPVDGTWSYPQWMVLIGGCKGFISMANGSILAGPFASMMSKATQRLAAREQVFQVDYVRDLRCLIARSVNDEERRCIYDSALDSLNQTFGVFYEVQGQKDLVDIFSWVVLAENFLPLLADEEQEALVLLSYFCVLLNKLSRQWWLDGWVDCLMGKIYAALDEERRTWIIWPMEEVGWLPRE